MFNQDKHTKWMKFAYNEAVKAYKADEVPIGSIIVLDNKIIGRGYNKVESLLDSTAHAELIAITSAQNYLNSKNLEGCTLYATLEPCLMCHGAIYWSKINTIVYGASDIKRGFSGYNLEIDRKIKIIKGVMEEESRELLDKFFKKIRG